MAAIKLSQLYGGGQFKAEKFFGSLTHSLSSATPLTISPAAGKTLRLDSLGSSLAIAGCTVSVGGVDVISGLSTANGSNDPSVGLFAVSNVAGSNGSAAFMPSFVQPLIAFEPDQTITISTTTVAASTIFYSYSYGE